MNKSTNLLLVRNTKRRGCSPRLLNSEFRTQEGKSSTAKSIFFTTAAAEEPKKPNHTKLQKKLGILIYIKNLKSEKLKYKNFKSNSLDSARQSFKVQYYLLKMTLRFSALYSLH